MHDRTYRFLIPPILLVVYVAVHFAALKNEPVGKLPKNVVAEVVQFFRNEGSSVPATPGNTPEALLFGTLFAGGVVILTSGILISTVTTYALHLASKKWNVYHTRIFETEAAAKTFLRSVGHPAVEEIDNKEVNVIASNILLHGVCNEGIESFLDRRWNTCVMSANCVMVGIIAVLFFVVYHWSQGAFIPITVYDFGVAGLTWIFGNLGWNARRDIIATGRAVVGSRGLWRTPHKLRALLSPAVTKARVTPLAGPEKGHWTL